MSEKKKVVPKHFHFPSDIVESPDDQLLAEWRSKEDPSKPRLDSLKSIPDQYFPAASEGRAKFEPGFVDPDLLTPEALYGVMREGTYIEMTLTDPIKGSVWSCTDRNEEYWGDGTNWVLYTAHPFGSGLWVDRPVAPMDGDLYRATDLMRLFRYMRPLFRWMPVDDVPTVSRLVSSRTKMEVDGDVWTIEQEEAMRSKLEMIFEDGLDILRITIPQITDYVKMYSKRYEWEGFPWRFLTQLKFDKATDVIAYWGGEEVDLCWIEFELDTDGKLWAVCHNGTTTFYEEITGIDVTQYHNYRIDHNSLSEVKFFIDDVLKKTCSDPAQIPTRLSHYLFVNNQITGATMNFGDQNVEAYGQAISNRISGSKFTANLTGKAISITVYISVATGTQKAKCAIYKASDMSFVAETAERTDLTGTSWQTFTFVSPPDIIQGTDYWLLCWSDSTSVFMKHDSYIPNQGLYKTVTYDGWPTPTLSGHTLDNRRYSIYCTVEYGASLIMKIRNIYGGKQG